MSLLSRCPICGATRQGPQQLARHLAMHDTTSAPTARGRSALLADAMLADVLEGFAAHEGQHEAR